MGCGKGEEEGGKGRKRARGRSVEGGMGGGKGSSDIVFHKERFGGGRREKKPRNKIRTSVGFDGRMLQRKYLKSEIRNPQ